VAGAGSCSWFELAEEVFRAAEVDCRAVACSTADLGRPAPRPPYSVLASEREGAPRLPDWREGVAGYLAERAQVLR
jgi:dTDP-4-dehydrorhamnose reductase